ncbi:unnamed protein product [Allacma fusca]|uniref:Uncharacterized protein n=1 Tax=Allacma fusca TaxID=39272 RepID=A0A8J2P6K8_9HEXA|nr:unnamed protein product [Allacma fusca]
MDRGQRDRVERGWEENDDCVAIMSLFYGGVGVNTLVKVCTPVGEPSKFVCQQIIAALSDWIRRLEKNRVEHFLESLCQQPASQ